MVARKIEDELVKLDVAQNKIIWERPTNVFDRI
jgi:ribosomal protein L31E